jgi:hypothetical protein
VNLKHPERAYRLLERIDAGEFIDMNDEKACDEYDYCKTQKWVTDKSPLGPGEYPNEVYQEVFLTEPEGYGALAEWRMISEQKKSAKRNTTTGESKTNALIEATLFAYHKYLTKRP